MTTGTGNAEMGEHGELMKAFREQSRERKQSNRERSTQRLLENGVKFQSRNDGLHLMIDTPAGRVNFYPSTGLYNGVLEGRGVFTLLDELKRLKMAQIAKKQEGLKDE